MDFERGDALAQLEGLDSGGQDTGASGPPILEPVMHSLNLEINHTLKLPKIAF